MQTIYRKILILLFTLIPLFSQAQMSSQLSGTVISSGASSTRNAAGCAFDGDMNTYFAASQGSNGWVGLDLGTAHRITGVAWAARNNSSGPARTCLAVFEGANRDDFLDAVPLYMTTENGVVATMTYADVCVTRAFRYVRYIGPHNSSCNIAELAFYGQEVDASLEENADEAKVDTFYRPTNLPLVVVHVKDAVEPYDKVNDLEMITSIIAADSTMNVSQPGTIRLRGNGSNTFEKKPYRIKFDKKQNVLDAPAKAKKWTLINNYGDKTLMRNILAFDLSRRVGFSYTPFCTPVDVMVNGEYKGAYQLCDQVEVAKKRIEIEEMDSTCVEGEALTGGYFIEVDAYAYEETSCFYSYKGNPVTIKYPSDDDIVPEQSDYISGVFNRMETALYSKSFASPETGYRKYLDIETFLKHFIVGEFSGNTDTYWSVFMYKHRNNDTLYVGPVWDFDLAYENDGRTYPINSLDDYIYATVGSCAGQMRDFVNRIIKDDPNTINELCSMWAELRSSGKISEQALLAVVDEQAELLDASQKLNFKRWNIMNSYVHQNPVVWGSYAAEVDNVKKYIRDRIAWFDKKLDYDATRIQSTSPRSSATSLYHIYTVHGMLVGAYRSMVEARDAIAHGIYVVSHGGSHAKVAF